MPLLVGKLDMQSHLDELAGAIRTLASQDFVRSDRIFVLGNSEGTLHALRYQVHDPAIPLAGLVLVGPPGRSVGAVARAQLAEQARLVPNGDALLALYDQAIARFLAGQPMLPDPALPAGVQQLLQALEAPANLPFARQLWTADAASLLAQVDVPVLVIVGKKDIQVDWREDGGPLQRAAAGRPSVTFLFPDDANHVLKYEPRPRTELVARDVTTRYNASDTSLDAASMAGIESWLLAHL
ncbi:MAG: alpha/beta hydrolase [Chloroflexi bacterium]|nr:alpha/beta hydrolase [Chloroflexota bacterium]